MFPKRTCTCIRNSPFLNILQLLVCLVLPHVPRTTPENAAGMPYIFFLFFQYMLLPPLGCSPAGAVLEPEASPKRARAPEGVCGVDRTRALN